MWLEWERGDLRWVQPHVWGEDFPGTYAGMQLPAQQGGFWGVMGRSHGNGTGNSCSNTTKHCSGWYYSPLRPPFGVRTCTLLLWRDASSPCEPLFVTLRTGSSEVLLSQPCLPPRVAQCSMDELLAAALCSSCPTNREGVPGRDRRCHSPHVRRDQS